jgi:hypothetical protein
MDNLYSYFGDPEDQAHGYTGFKNSMHGSDGFKLLYNPTTVSKNGDYQTFVIPGAACEKMDPKTFVQLVNYLDEKKVRFHCTRMDYKFDNVPFSPFQFKWMVKNKLLHLRSTENKQKTILNDEKNETGKVGSITVYLGSQSSNRSICCYDVHGFTRLEVRTRGEFANAYFLALMVGSVEKWYDWLAAITLDYIDFDDERWKAMVQDNKRAYMKVGIYKNPTLDKLVLWAKIQLAPAISILYDVLGKTWLEALIQDGRRRRSSIVEYRTLLHEFGLDGDKEWSSL